MLKKKQLSKSFLDISNTYVKGELPTHLQSVQDYLRRKSQGTFQMKTTEGKPKENSHEISKYSHLSSLRNLRSGSEVFNKSSELLCIKLQENDESQNASTMTPPSSKRFQRKSDRKAEDVNFISRQKVDIHKQKKFLEDEPIIKQPNEIFGLYQTLHIQNTKLKESLAQKDKKINLLNSLIRQKDSLIRDKESQIKKSNEHLTERQGLIKQLEDKLFNKSKTIMKLQQKTIQLEIKLSQSKINRNSQAIEAEYTQKMNLLYERLRYREMEVYMLKKQQFEIKQIEKKLKITCKQNIQLKQRIRFLVKKKYAQEIDRESNSSLSYSCFSFSTEELVKK